MKKAYFAALFSVCIFYGFTSGVRFYVCPYELSTEVKSKIDIGKKKEILAHQEYRVIVVQMKTNGSVSVAQHYRHKHTFSNRIHPRSVSYDNLLTLTAMIIVDDVTTENGIEIKNLDDNKWHIYWLSDKDIKDLKRTGIVCLPPCDGLLLLHN